MREGNYGVFKVFRSWVFWVVTATAVVDRQTDRQTEIRAAWRMQGWPWRCTEQAHRIPGGSGCSSRRPTFSQRRSRLYLSSLASSEAGRSIPRWKKAGKPWRDLWGKPRKAGAGAAMEAPKFQSGYLVQGSQSRCGLLHPLFQGTRVVVVVMRPPALHKALQFLFCLRGSQWARTTQVLLPSALRTGWRWQKQQQQGGHQPMPGRRQQHLSVMTSSSWQGGLNRPCLSPSCCWWSLFDNICKVFVAASSLHLHRGVPEHEVPEVLLYPSKCNISHLVQWML